MNIQTLERATQLQAEIQGLQEKVDMFHVERHEYRSTVDREKAISESKKIGSLFRFMFRRTEKANEAEVQVNVPPFSGGKTILVDAEFIEYCQEYFEKKLNEKLQELERL